VQNFVHAGRRAARAADMRAHKPHAAHTAPRPAALL
jgi:hypothetical protein